VPGPYIVVTNEQGMVAPEQKGVIANALASWSGTKLEAFIICFRPASKPVDWDAAFKALESVSHELKGSGAKIVVMPASRVCDGPSHSTLPGRSSVEIMGVIRA